MATSTFTNRLASETSPYLRQHASNPVDWHPWGPEALDRSRCEGKPIFLSIGYSACHWCHVMEHESFMDPEIAVMLNLHFINIKVDREERPDLDQIYMNAVTAMTGHGGWPMSVFLTPDLEPFFAGTYFPPDERYPNMPSFKRLLTALTTAWEQRRSELIGQAGQVAQHLRQSAVIDSGEHELSPEWIRHAARTLSNIFDPRDGGFGRAPKFPHSMDIRLLLRAWKRFGDDDALRMARLSLDKMAMGGIYDHLAGGFHRYSTDARWLVPHFEKMLYDNALLVQSYLDAYQATGDPLQREVVEETLAWIANEMTSPEGAFYSTLDADSEGEEGKFYVWSAREVESILGRELFDLFADVYDVSDGGNWEGHNILHRPKTYEQNARLLRLAEPDLKTQLGEGKRKLLEARGKRVRPGRDEKILTAWNGLMIDALAQAGQILDPVYGERAAKAAEFILSHMRRPDGRLFRTLGAGTPAKLDAYLEDYSFLVNGLVTLYECTFQPRWIQSAIELAEVMIDQFWDADQGGFFFTGKDHEKLIVRSKDPQDNAVPSGNSMAATALLRLGRLTGNSDFEEKAIRTLRLFGGLMQRHPTAFGQMLCAVDFRVGPVEEFAIRGPKDEALRWIHAHYLPNKVVAASSEADSDGSFRSHARLVPLLADKPLHGGAVTTYICRQFACEEPLVGIENLRKRLDELHSAQTSPSTSSDT